MKEEKCFLEEIREAYYGIDVLDPETERKEREHSARAWALVARKRGHGLSKTEEGYINI